MASDVGWAGHADVLGERHTLIRVNADLPISSLRLLGLVCHEAYPGHHTENACKAVSLIQGAGRAELCVYVHPSPQALLSQGPASQPLDAPAGDHAAAVAASR